MKAVFDGVEFTACTFVPARDNCRVAGLYIHDLSDEFHNGDCVSTEDMPRTEKEAADVLCEYTDSDCEVLKTVQWTD